MVSATIAERFLRRKRATSVWTSDSRNVVVVLVRCHRVAPATATAVDAQRVIASKASFLSKRRVLHGNSSV